LKYFGFLKKYYLILWKTESNCGRRVSGKDQGIQDHPEREGNLHSWWPPFGRRTENARGDRGEVLCIQGARETDTTGDSQKG